MAGQGTSETHPLLHLRLRVFPQDSGVHVLRSRVHDIPWRKRWGILLPVSQLLRPAQDPHIRGEKSGNLLNGIGNLLNVFGPNGVKGSKVIEKNHLLRLAHTIDF